MSEHHSGFIHLALFYTLLLTRRQPEQLAKDENVPTGTTAVICNSLSILRAYTSDIVVINNDILIIPHSINSPYSKNAFVALYHHVLH